MSLKRVDFVSVNTGGDSASAEKAPVPAARNESFLSEQWVPA